jgi:hypothetical protein
VRLGRGCEVILLGGDKGTADAARELGVRHVPDVNRNEYGTPLLDSVFDAASSVAGHDLLCYLNADIMLMSDFLDAVARLEPERLLMISRRWNVDLDGPWDFDDPNWQTKLRDLTVTRGHQKTASGGPDFFVFRRGQWAAVPPFALGRTRWDNWLIYAARTLGVPVIDASPCVMAVHQNHDCGHADGGWAGAWHGAEAQHNNSLMPDGADTYNFLDATHLMTPEGPRPAMSPEHLARRLERRLAAWFDQRLFLANALHELGRHEDEFDAVTHAGPACTTPERTLRYARAGLRALFAMNRRKQAEDFIAALLGGAPSPLMGYRLASICEGLRAFETATALFRAVLTQESHDATVLKAGAHYHLARIAVETGDPEAAQRHAEACVADNPKHKAARELLGHWGGNRGPDNRSPTDGITVPAEARQPVVPAPPQPAGARD